LSRTGFVFHPAYTDHLTGEGHPERPQRLTSVTGRLDESGVMSELDRTEPSPVATRWLETVHDPAYVERVRQACEEGRSIMDSADTAICPDSYQAALLAAGGALEAADRLMDGSWSNAFVACRPPGHHAEAAMAMGFCLFNNAAVAAAYLRRRHQLERVAILDWDVHHGNGTQHVFETDPAIFYASLHQWPLYPGTGRADERGQGEGTGATLNCPMDPGDGDDAYLQTLDEQVLPALERFAPGVIILSAGFDAHRDDPLSATQVSEAGYREMTRRVMDLAASCAGGRILSMLEGGYDLDALAASVQVHLEEMRSASLSGPA
jgi:acetoin utilization deacetylase AcuC-like enzyme